MTDATAVEKKHRSPAYPFVGLGKAVERAKSLYAAERRHAAPLNAVVGHWGYKEKSSGGLQTVSALKQFGLLSDAGSGADRKVQLTDLAFKILLDEVPNSPERVVALKKAALSPKLYSEMFERWGVELPSDENVRTYLKRDKLFNDEAVGGVIKDYKDTLAYSKLTSSDKVDTSSPSGSGAAVVVGDYVEWESQGILQFEARKITSLSADGKYVFVEGETTGIPMEQVKRVEPPTQFVAGAHIPSGAQVFAPTVGNAAASTSVRGFGVALAREVSALEEGEAMLQWPATLSADSVAELEDWLNLVIKKMKRRYAAKSDDGKE